MSSHNKRRRLGTVLVALGGRRPEQRTCLMAYHACNSDGRYHGLTRATILPRRLFMVPLIAAAVLVGSQPAAHAEFDPPGPDVWCAEKADTDPFCQLSSVFSDDVYKLPELGGSFVFVSGGQFAIGTDEARLTGDITNGGGGAIQRRARLERTQASRPRHSGHWPSRPLLRRTLHIFLEPIHRD